jgi:Ni,Fe-hydrogenase III component G
VGRGARPSSGGEEAGRSASGWTEKTIRDRFKGKILKWRAHNSRRFYMDVAPEHILECSRILFEDMKARFIIASGVDTPRGIVEILYHFDFFQASPVLSVRVAVPKPDLAVDSISPVIKGAEWIEREISELIGVTFKNHPNPGKLLLPSDWPEGDFPLRRDR